MFIIIYNNSSLFLQLTIIVIGTEQFTDPAIGGCYFVP